MVQMTCLFFQQSTSTSTWDPNTDSSSSDLSDESGSSREGELDGRACVGSQEEEQMRASSSGRGGSDEVADLKRQLAASQDQLRASQGTLRMELELVEMTAVLFPPLYLDRQRLGHVVMFVLGSYLYLLCQVTPYADLGTKH